MTLSMTIEGIPAEEVEELCLVIGEALNGQSAIAASYSPSPPPPIAVIESDRPAPTAKAEDEAVEPAQQAEVSPVAGKPRIVMPRRLPAVGSDLKIEVPRPLKEDQVNHSPFGSDADSVIKEIFKDCHPALSLQDIR